MRIRREIKKAWFVMKLMLSFGGLTEDEKIEINKTKTKFELKLNEIDTTKENNEIILNRRHLLHTNSDLEIIFRMFWMIIQLYKDIITDIIKEEGYILFNILVQHSLIGNDINYNEALNFAKTEYINDTACYGPLSRECFFDILSELIEMWSENGHAKLATSLAWALLNSICDINAYPPRFRKIEKVKCISALDESQLLTQFAQSAKQRALMRKKVEWLEMKCLSPQTMFRLMTRRNSVCILQNTQDMLMIMNAHQIPNKNNLMNDDDDDENEAINHERALYHSLSMYNTYDNEDDEIYYTNNSTDGFSPRNDSFEINSVPSQDTPKSIPPLIHTGTILRLCPDIQTTSSALGIVASMKIASKLAHYATDARKSVSLNSITNNNNNGINQFNSISDDSGDTLSTPSVMNWLKKVSYLVRPISIMSRTSSAMSRQESNLIPEDEIEEDDDNYNNQHLHDYSYIDINNPISHLHHIIDKPKTPLDDRNERLEEEKSNEKFFSKYFLDRQETDPLIELFSVKQINSGAHQLYVKAAAPSVSRNKRGPTIIKTNPKQLAGFKLEESIYDNDFESINSPIERELEAKSIITSRHNLPPSVCLKTLQTIPKQEKKKRNITQNISQDIFITEKLNHISKSTTNDTHFKNNNNHNNHNHHSNHNHHNHNHHNHNQINKQLSDEFLPYHEENLPKFLKKNRKPSIISDSSVSSREDESEVIKTQDSNFSTPIKLYDHNNNNNNHHNHNHNQNINDSTNFIYSEDSPYINNYQHLNSSNNQRYGMKSGVELENEINDYDQIYFENTNNNNNNNRGNNGKNNHLNINDDDNYNYNDDLDNYNNHVYAQTQSHYHNKFDGTYDKYQELDNEDLKEEEEFKKASLQLLNKNSITVSKLNSHSKEHEGSNSFDSKNENQLSIRILSNNNNNNNNNNNDNNDNNTQKNQLISSSNEQFQRNEYFVADTRKFQSSDSIESSRRSERYKSRNSNDNFQGSILSTDSYGANSSLTSSSVMRPLTTGSIAMDQFYNKKYYDQLTQNLLSDSLSTSIRPNNMNNPIDRCQSAKLYRKLRTTQPSFMTGVKERKKSSPIILSNTSRSDTSNSMNGLNPTTTITTTLPQAIRVSSSSHLNQQPEKLFIQPKNKEKMTSKGGIKTLNSRNNNNNNKQEEEYVDRNSSEQSNIIQSSSTDLISLHSKTKKSSTKREKKHENKLIDFKKYHYMESTGHLRPETYEGVQKSLKIVTYFTEDNYLR